MTRHKFHAQGKKKVYTSTASSSLQQVFSDDSVDDFSDNETPPLAPTYKRRKGFRSDGNVASLDSKDDLAVQRVKVRQAVEFLESCWNGGNKKLLVICGPPGSGKTTLVETVAKEMGCSLIRWNKILFGKADNKETQLLDSYSVWRENTFPNESVDELMVSCRYQALATEEYSSARSVIVVDENIVSKRDNRKMEQIGTELEWIAQQTIYPTIVSKTRGFAIRK